MKRCSDFKIICVSIDQPDGESHSFQIVKSLLNEELEDIIRMMSKQAVDLDEAGITALNSAERRYRKAYKVAMRWIKNYTELNFRSLGSYTRDELNDIAARDDAF